MISVSTFTKAFHVTSLVLHVNAFVKFNQLEYSKSDDLRVREMETFGPRYFTCWNMFIQSFYLALAIYTDFRPLFTQRKTTFSSHIIPKVKGYVFTLMFPCSLFVASMFWCLYAINRDWVLPEVVDGVVPKWLNHSVHTYILVVLLVESVLTEHRHLPTFKEGCVGLTVLGMVYFTVFSITYVQFGRWIYGIFYVLNWPQRIIYVLFTNALGYVFLKVGLEIQRYRNERNQNVISKEA